MFVQLNIAILAPLSSIIGLSAGFRVYRSDDLGPPFRRNGSSTQYRHITKVERRTRVIFILRILIREDVSVFERGESRKLQLDDAGDPSALRLSRRICKKRGGRGRSHIEPRLKWDNSTAPRKVYLDRKSFSSVEGSVHRTLVEENQALCYRISHIVITIE